MNARAIALFLGALAVLAIAYYFWPRSPAAGNAGEILAHAWERGDTAAIYDLSADGEKAVFPKSALDSVHKAVVDGFLGGIQMIEVKSQEVETKPARSEETFGVTYLAKDGTKFTAPITVFANAERRWAGMNLTVGMIVTVYLMEKRSIDFRTARAEARKLVNAELQRHGVREFFDPVNGRLTPMQ
jgi:hypothetical protein